jgi:hypothetical protein
MTQTTNNFILLKWGTLKGWNFSGNEKAIAILNKYIESGMTIGCAQQADTPMQKQLLCDLVRAHEGPITSDWDGKSFTKDSAIKYIMNYGNGE